MGGMKPWANPTTVMPAARPAAWLNRPPVEGLRRRETLRRRRGVVVRRRDDEKTVGLLRRVRRLRLVTVVFDVRRAAVVRRFAVVRRRRLVAIVVPLLVGFTTHKAAGPGLATFTLTIIGLLDLLPLRLLARRSVRAKIKSGGRSNGGYD